MCVCVSMSGMAGRLKINRLERSYIDMKEDEMIAEIMSHLDKESVNGVYRMSVLMDENADEAKTISKQCCNMYGRPASETVGLLDMYTDMNAGRPDNE